ncbi:MAG: hypothetical protein JWO20_2212 [Candidatus Angelobacter sp.]|nr:hypothetical protein [Candidatus Angelobacter sp.]
MVLAWIGQLRHFHWSLMQEAWAQRGSSFRPDDGDEVAGDGLVPCFVYLAVVEGPASHPRAAMVEPAGEKARPEGKLAGARSAPALAVYGSQPKQPIQRSWRM